LPAIFLSEARQIQFHLYQPRKLKVYALYDCYLLGSSYNIKIKKIALIFTRHISTMP
jgi:hypothetical protein